MSVEIDEVSSSDRETWNSFVEQAPHATVFHQYEALELFADLDGTDLRLLVGYKGQEPVGLLPLFESNRGPFTLLYSPPRKVYVMTLGPVRLNFEGLQRRRREKDNRRFVDACLDWIEAEIGADYINIKCTDRYTDVRPYLWNDFEASLKYIYVADVTPDVDDLFDGLSKDARRRIRKADEDAYEIFEGGAAEIQAIARQVRDRYEEQGRDYHLSPESLTKFQEALPDDQIHPYCLSVDGEFVGGLFVLEFGDTMILWQGAVRTEVDFSVNELLYWHLIEQAATNGLNRVDLTTAMVPSLADYKTKFSSELRPRYEVEWQTQELQVSSLAYNRLPDTGRDVIDSWLS